LVFSTEEEMYPIISKFLKEKLGCSKVRQQVSVGYLVSQKFVDVAGIAYYGEEIVTFAIEAKNILTTTEV
jgi:hypothetical protein